MEANNQLVRRGHIVLTPAQGGEERLEEKDVVIDELSFKILRLKAELKRVAATGPSATSHGGMKETHRSPLFWRPENAKRPQREKTSPRFGRQENVEGSTPPKRLHDQVEK